MSKCKNSLLAILLDQLHLKTFTLAIVLFALVSCATDNNSSNTASTTINANVINIAFSANSIAQQHALTQFIYNKASMTKELKSLGHNFSVQLLKTGSTKNNYVRISSLKLDNTPVIVAISSADLNSPTFVNILKNAATTPIGKMLFAPNAHIKRRDGMEISAIHIKDIQNSVLHSYLTTILDYQDGQIVVARTSQFYHQNEIMNITEYILPSINKFIYK